MASSFAVDLSSAACFFFSHHAAATCLATAPAQLLVMVGGFVLLADTSHLLGEGGSLDQGDLLG